MYRFNKKTLDYEKVNTNALSAKVLLACLSVSILTGFVIAPSPTVKKLSQEEKLIVIREYNGFTEEKLVSKIKALNFKYPHIVMAQAYWESGKYSSPVFKTCNNLFGMKEATQRANLAKGTKKQHAYYENWQESLYDYALFYSTYLYDIKTEGEYYGYLEQYYAEDPDYVKRIKSIVVSRKLESKFKK